MLTSLICIAMVAALTRLLSVWIGRIIQMPLVCMYWEEHCVSTPPRPLAFCLSWARMFAFLSVFLQFRFKCFILMCFLLHFSSRCCLSFSMVHVFIFSIFFLFKNAKLEYGARSSNVSDNNQRFVHTFPRTQCHYDAEADADAFQFVSLLKLFDLCKCVRLFASPFVRILFVFVFHAAFFYFSICLFLVFFSSLFKIQTLKCEIKREIIIAVVKVAAASTGMQNIHNYIESELECTNNTQHNCIAY